MKSLVFAIIAELLLIITMIIMFGVSYWYIFAPVAILLAVAVGINATKYIDYIHAGRTAKSQK